MASKSMTFSIHHEQWQEAWVAATAAVKSRKRQQVDFDIQKRIQYLIQEFGPQSAKPLTLRVYGTMLKGFCVLNNQRARSLYTDCERAVFMFNQRALESCGDADAKQPPTKKQRTDAMALDLQELAKVKESDLAHWTAQPEDDAALLHLETDTLPVILPEAQVFPQRSLLEDAHLLDEHFAALDMETVVPLDAAAEAIRLATAAEAAAIASMTTSQHAPVAFPPVTEVEEVQSMATTLEQPVPLIAEFLASVGDVRHLMWPHLAQTDAGQSAVQHRGPRCPPELSPGQVLGFDKHVELPSSECEQWQGETQSIGGSARSRSDYDCELSKETSGPDRLGTLNGVLDPWSQAAAIGRMLALNEGTDLREGENGMSAVQALLSGTAETMSAEERKISDVRKEVDAVTDAFDPFRPYVPQKPSSLMQGADMELSNLLGHESSAQDAANVPEDDEIGDVKYDAQTAQVAAILRRYMDQTQKKPQTITLDDLIPPSTTDQAVAARTFHAVLTLATSGELQTEQAQAYGPILLSTL